MKCSTVGICRGDIYLHTMNIYELFVLWSHQLDHDLSQEQLKLQLHDSAMSPTSWRHPKTMCFDMVGREQRKQLPSRWAQNPWMFLLLRHYH